MNFPSDDDGGSLLQTVGDGAFNKCRSLEQISLPNSVHSIGRGAFGSYNYHESTCTLQEITLPSSLVSLQPHLFKNCKFLHTVVIPDGVTAIGSKAFEGCDALEEITMRGVTSISSRAFRYCQSLHTVNLGSPTIQLSSGMVGTIQLSPFSNTPMQAIFDSQGECSACTEGMCSRTPFEEPISRFDSCSCTPTTIATATGGTATLTCN